MAKNPKEMLASWLKDAYAMEEALVPVLENHAKDAKDFPEMAERDRQHADQTRHHAELVKQCLDRLSEKPSTVKSAIGGMFGAMQSVSTGAFGDEVVKNCLSDFAAENFEIASYTALIAAAQEVGDQETARICEQIRSEEEDMADFIDEHLPMTVRTVMMQKATANK